MRFKRALSKKILRLATQFPAVVLTGARQTGKTTLLRELFPDHSYASLDLPATAALAEEDPTGFLARFAPPVLVDEVQYAPGLFRNLKVAIDKDRENNGQFILTGSQKFSLLKEVSDSLAGRCALLELEALSMAELEETGREYIEAQSPTAILARGMYPQLWKDPSLQSEDFYSSYFATYIERDVRQILNIGSLRDFDRFVRACAIRSGQLVNKSEIAKDAGITAVTGNQWLSVLQASNQISLLEPYFSNLSKRLVKSPKLYFNDSGLLCFLLGLSEQGLQSSYHLGAVWETFVFSELRKHLLATPQATLWFYRDRKEEVDFLINLEGKLHLLECKWAEQVDQSAVASLERVRSYFSDLTGNNYLVTRTPTPYPLGQNSRAINGFELHELSLD